MAEQQEASQRKHPSDQSGEQRAEGLRRAAVLTCFLTSGATALAYEVVWVRMLTLVFGATVLSVGSVLAAYMAGLALGSWHWSRRADRTSRPLRLYAFLEFGIAGAALLTPFLFQLIQGIYRSLFVGGLSDFSSLSVVRFLLCLPALLLPTFLMGGTLPFLARFYTSSLSRIGRGAGDLYSVNTLGAVIGTVLTGFVVIPALGVKGTLVAAAVLNAAIASVAYVLSLSAPVVSEASTSVASRSVVPTDVSIAVVLFGFGLSGFAAMIFEVAWTRALIQIFGNSTYAFTTMLASFLIGLAFGAAVAGRFIDNARHPYFAFAMVEFLVGVWAAAATPLIEWLPPLFLRAYDRSGGSFAALQLLQFQVCCLLMLPTTMGLGAVFPVVSRIYSSRAGGAGKSVGIPYAANTVGTVLGALMAGFLLLPRIGIEASILVGALLNLLVWAAVMATSRQTVLRPGLVFALGAIGLLSCGRLGFVRLDPQIMTAGVYMYPEYFLTLEREDKPIRKAVQLQKVLYHREGYSSSVGVLRVRSGDLALQTNGKTDASTGDLSSQRMVAHLPLLLKPGAKDVLIIGLASGCTCGSVLLHPVERVDCVEIEPAMKEAARFFNNWNHQCLRDKRLHLLIQDARNYVMMSDRQYDVITAEPTNPWIAGVNNLFTADYYRQCHARLKKGGAMCQWFPAYNFSEEELRTALATFASVFPCVTVWSFPRLRTDFFAVGAGEPLTVDPVAVARALRGAVREDLEAAGTEDLWRLAGGFLLDERTTREFCRGAPLNTDERPRLEFSTPRHLYDPKAKVRALEVAYAAGRQSQLVFSPKLGAAALSLLGTELAKGSVVTEASFVAHHPNDLTPGNALRDTAELRLQVKSPGGAALLRAAPLPRKDWPESLAVVHPASGSSSTAKAVWVDEESQVARTGPRVWGGRVSIVWELPVSPQARKRLSELTGFVEPL